jgi:hypothetical protein
VPIERAWQLTPRELQLEANGARLRQERELDRALELGVFVAWHTAAFSRTKRMPHLKAALRRLKPGQRTQTQAEQMAIMKAAIEAATQKVTR